ncbi:hypothetical protein [Microbacterium lacus]
MYRQADVKRPRTDDEALAGNDHAVWPPHRDAGSTAHLQPPVSRMTLGCLFMLLWSLFAIGMGIVFVKKASSIGDMMWTRNESLTRHSRLLAMPRSYYLWLCRIGGAIFVLIGLVIALLTVLGIAP